MKQTFIAGMTLTAAIALASTSLAEDPVPGDAPGWTGVTNPQDVILARQALMAELERLIQPIDSFIAGEPADPADLSSAAVTISQMLPALPHLFPPTTDLYDPADDTPLTIALPAIWQDFPTFYALAAASSASAERMASMTEAQALRSGGASLRASCDACHALFLRPYVPGTVSTEDLQFDFEGLFE